MHTFTPTSEPRCTKLTSNNPSMILTYDLVVTSSEDSNSDSPLERSVEEGLLANGGGGGGGEEGGAGTPAEGGRGGVGSAIRNGAGIFILFIKCNTCNWVVFSKYNSIHSGYNLLRSINENLGV